MTSALLLLAVTQVPTITPGNPIPGLRPLAIAAAPRGSLVAMTLEDGSARIFDASRGQTVRQLPKMPQPAYAVAWSPDGKQIATGDESARVWIIDAASGRLVREYRRHQRGVQKLSFNSSSAKLLSTGKDDAILIYDLRSPRGVPSATILGKGQNFYSGTFLPNRTDFGVATLTPASFVMTEAGGTRSRLAVPGNQGALDFAVNGAGTRFAVAGRDGKTYLYDARGVRVGSLGGHQDWVMTVGFSPNGRLLASSSSDRTVNVYTVGNGQRIATLQNQSMVGSPVTFTACGRFLLTVSDAGFLQVNRVAPPQR